MKYFIAFLILLMTTISGYAARCSDYTNCRQAVVKWCTGQHNRADGDNDGIPCENVCRSRDQVRQIMREIGCNR